MPRFAYMPAPVMVGSVLRRHSGRDSKTGGEEMREERLQILQMLKDDKITVTEANSLLEALNPSGSVAGAANQSGRFMRVRVVEEGKQRVNVNLPLGLVRVASRLIPRDLWKDSDSIDWEDLVKAVQQGARGKLIEVTNDDGTLVEITVD